MSKRSFFLFLGMAFCLLACQPSAPETHSPSPAPSQSSAEIQRFRYQLEELVEGEPVQTVAVALDYTFREPLRYEAYSFGPMLRKLLASHRLDSSKAEVQFFCKDGYAPIQTCEEVLAGGGGFLAFRDVRQEEGQAWPEGKAEEMSPFYLVWEQGAKVDKHLSWPFGLTHIELRSHSESYQRFFPKERPELTEAYELYRVNCQKCHALDGNGGSMAPDFHSPKNITEYWQRTDIVAFAQAPQSYRRNSHMPPIKSLTEAQLHQVVDYLSYLVQKK